MNVVNKRRRGLHYVSAAAAVAFISPVVHADATLEEVIVTAQKREENVQTTPISLQVFNAETIEQRNINNVADLAAVTPALRIIPFGQGPTTLNIYIRGVGAVDSQITEDPPVGVYVNGVYIARPIGLGTDVAGLERIEVLRGPQGTLYGRNTTGGAINLITAKPVDQFHASQLVSFGNYGAFRTQSMVNLPVTDTFWVRANINWDKRDGWLRNSGQGRDFSGYDRVAGRFDARWKPNDALTVDYGYDRSKSDYTADLYQLVTPTAGFASLPHTSNRLGSATLAVPFKGSNDLATGHTLSVALQTPIGELKSITAYRDVHSHQYEDYSGNATISIYRNDPVETAQHQISEELQLVGGNDNKTVEYIGGLYYFKENGRLWDRDVVDLYGIQTLTNVKAENTAYAAYGQLTLRPDAASPWSTTLGLRYSKDKREAKFIATNPDLSDHHTQFSNTSPSVVVNYQYTEDALIYGKFVQGYKAGGFNFREGNFDTPFGPEKITTFELGWKTEWLNRRLRWNNAIFYSNYKDIQLDVNVPTNPDPTVTVTKNAGKARVYGVETELNYAATEDLRLNLSYAYLGNRFLEVQNEIASHYTLANAPTNTVNSAVDWDVVHLPVGIVNATLDYSYRSNSMTSTSQRAHNGDLVPHYSLTDLRVSLTGEDWVGKGTNARVSLWVRNMFDTQYRTDPFGSFEQLHAIRLVDWGAPRTVGVDFKISY